MTRHDSGTPFKELPEREDGLVFYSGKWQSMESVENHRKHCRDKYRAGLRKTMAALKAEEHDLRPVKTELYE